jgi:hypothetical protein
VKPFLRPIDRGKLAPVGWVAEPAGRWGGKEVDVVFDPTRHQVLVVRSAVPDGTRSSLGTAGFRRLAVDGTQELWVRDRLTVARAALDRLARAASRHRSAEVRGLGL